MDETPTCCITGAAGLIGRGLVRHFTAKGWRVAALDLEAPEEGAIRLACDVSDEAAVRQAMARIGSDWGRLDLLVNNAGVASPFVDPLEELEVATFRTYLDTNLTGPLICVKSALPLLRAGQGAVVNVTSTRAFMSEPRSEGYAAAKGGLTALTHALSISLGPDLRVNAVAPGWISGADDLRDVDHAQHPAGRVGRPEDIAGAVDWLAGADFVTGQTVVVDGGMTVKMIYAH